MGLKLRVDVREHAWLEAYRSGHEETNPFVEVETVALELGDFEIVWEEKGIRYVFERKTFQDLAASMKDGRYREQKARLLGNLSAHQITYILEEMNTQCLFGYGSRKTGHSSFFGLSKTAFQSFLYHARYRDGIHIHISSGIHETIAYVLGFMERICAHPEYFSGSENAVQ